MAKRKRVRLNARGRAKKARRSKLTRSKPHAKPSRSTRRHTAIDKRTRKGKGLQRKAKDSRASARGPRRLQRAPKGKKSRGHGAKTAREIAYLRERVRKQDEVIKDLTRTPKQRERLIKYGIKPDTTDDEIDEPLRPPAGAIITRDAAGNIESFELPSYTGSHYEDVDFSESDYDDVYDDVGDEDEDSYGEDAAA